MEKQRHAMDQELGLHIFTHVGEIFEQYQQMTTILGTLAHYKPRDISIIYRKTLGKGRPQIAFNTDMACVSFLIQNYRDEIKSAEQLKELAAKVANLAESELESGEPAPDTVRSEVNTINAETSQKAGTASQPQSPAARDDQKLDDWIVEEINKTN